MTTPQPSRISSANRRTGQNRLEMSFSSKKRAALRDRKTEPAAGAVAAFADLSSGRRQRPLERAVRGCVWRSPVPAPWSPRLVDAPRPPDPLRSRLDCAPESQSSSTSLGREFAGPIGRHECHAGIERQYLDPDEPGAHVGRDDRPRPPPISLGQSPGSGRAASVTSAWSGHRFVYLLGNL
jgi:hypothetical protein